MTHVRAAIALLPQGLVDGVSLAPRVGALPHSDVHVGAAFDAAARAAVVEPLVARYAIAPHVRRTLSEAGLIGVLVGMACLERAGVINAEGGWKLDEEDREETGVMFASSFAHHEGAMWNVAERARREQLERLRARFAARIMGEEAMVEVAEVIRAEDEAGRSEAGEAEDPRNHEGRRIALQFTLDVHAQLAQLIGARGPNTYISNACASTTSAIQMASTLLKVGEAKRMLVVGSDAILSGPNTSPIVRSFVQLGAASTADDVADAVLPFSKRRDGFVLGEGAVALLLECESGRTRERLGDESVGAGSSHTPRVTIVSSRIANSAHHGTALDPHHIAVTLRRCVDDARGDLTIEEFAARSLYVSHETCTRSCAHHEIAALRSVFGDSAPRLRITNTKCYTGHSMGACVEDVAAVAALAAQRAPRVRLGEVDDAFCDLTFCGCDNDDGEEGFDFAIHVAMGMGSHVAIVVYGLSKP